MSKLSVDERRALRFMNRVGAILADEIRILTDLAPGILTDLRCKSLVRFESPSTWNITTKGRKAINEDQQEG